MTKSARGYSARLATSIAVTSALAVGLFASVAFAQSDATAEIQDLPVTVESGDTFTSILARELKSLDAWGEVAKYNKLAQPDQIKPGDVIVIPAELLRLKNYATVIFVKGMALHHNKANDSKSEVNKGDRIYSGDLIETDKDGFVSVSFNGGTSVNVQPESIMKINVLNCVDREVACEINLDSDKGQLGLDVKSVGFDKPTVFSINTPYASAAVRGTRFDFDVKDGNILGVTEGTVEISLNGVSNDIEIGKGVLAGEGRSVNDVFDLLAQPNFMLRDDINRVSGEDIINWQSLSDAANYLISYASSESMQDVLVSFPESQTYTKPDFPKGDVYVSARGVASNGLRGFTSKKKLTIVDIDYDAETPVLDISLGQEENEMQITAPGTAADNIEVKIGNRMEAIDGSEFIVADQVLHMQGGETLTIELDRFVDCYIQGRKVMSPETVSPYGLLYFFEKTEG